MDELNLLMIGLYVLTLVLLFLPAAALYKKRRHTWKTNRPRDAWSRARGTTSTKRPNIRKPDVRCSHIRTPGRPVG